jgi:hypothetical protein
LGVFRDAQDVLPECTPGLLDLEGLAERSGRHPEPGGSEQDRAQGLSGVEPVERVVVRGDDHEQLGRVVARVPGCVVRLSELRARKSAQGGRPRETDRRYRDVAGGHAVAPAGIPVGPLPQLGCVARRELLALDGVGEGCGQPLPHRRVGHRDQQRACAARLLHQCLQVVRRHGSATQAASIRPPAGDRRELDGVGGVSRSGTNRDGGEMAAVLGIGHPAHLHRHPGGRRERDEQVMQGGAAAQNQVTAIQVGRDEMSVPVGVQLYGVGTDPPAPGLRVVYGGRAQRVLDRRREVRGSTDG